MRYLLLIYTEETDAAPPPDVAEASHIAYAEFTADIKRRGLFQAGEALTPTSTATTVRVVDGETVATDGPIAETKETLGGFYLVEAADLDEAIAYAAMIPGAKRGSIEVRPVWDYVIPGLEAAAAGAES
jgi:hypothetical protein